MFSSTTTYHDSINPFPSSFPSSSSYPPTLPFLIDPENNINNFPPNNTLFDDPLVSHHPFTHDNINNAPFPQDTTNLALSHLLEQQDANYNNIFGGGDGEGGGNYGSSIIPNFLTAQKPAAAAAAAMATKKDRHSKIHTSQGLRDRRVRLSSEIARKFFDLQDMLEFDKPSNTLEWLFTKSESAIKELARSKNCSCRNNPSSEPSQYFVDSNNNKSFGGGGDSNGSIRGRSKLKWTQRDQDVCVQNKKESRERARARARERTCYKMLEDQRCPATATSNATQIMHQLRSSPIQLLQPYPHLLDNSDLAVPGGGDGFNVIEESIMIKRNMMSSSHHHHQNHLPIPNKEPGFNNNNMDYPLLQPYSTTPNWEIATMNMNLSTCYMNQW